MRYPWREASSVILAALKKPPLNLHCNYELLVLERSSKSSFMPNGCVFPGGATEPVDCDEAWLDLFSKFNLDVGSATKLRGDTPPILAKDDGCIPKLLSLKITAIRETFEETGILLCFGKDKGSVDSQKLASCSTFEGLNSWRIKVRENAKEFLSMCQQHDLCPDVNHLHLWSNWLTPTSYGPKRFDTAFFLTCLTEPSEASPDNKEIEKLSWFSPINLLELCERKEAWLPPPQFYETARLLQFKDIKDLNAFAINRAPLGCQRWMLIIKKASNASVLLLPGDDAYEVIDETTQTKPEEIKMSSEEFRNQFKVLHRMELREKTKSKIFVKNYEPKNGHVLPIHEV